MIEASKCPDCGGNLPLQASAGICPKCLLAAGLESAPPAQGTAPTAPQSTPAGRGFRPLAVAELAGRIPGLEILALLGVGGMGAVYKARQIQLDRLVAMKVLPPEVVGDSAFAERFSREAKALARLNHPNIVGIFDFGRIGDFYYLVMEFVDGANLREALRAGKLSPPEALAIVPQICDALQYAHDEGIVHRDIKPENILLDRRGRVKIADFGLAKLLGHQPADVSLTGTHQVMGTMRYMAPEQMTSSHLVDHRADIYSLGVVFYELLTGEVPLGRFAPPSQKVQVDVRLDEVVLRALEQEPAHRYQHASEVKSQLTSITNPAYGPNSIARKPPPADFTRSASVAAPVDWTTGPSASFSKPWGVYVVALLNIIGALLLMFAIMGDPESWIPPSAGHLWWSWEQTSTFNSYFICAMTLIASLGLFLWQPWARTLTIGTCWASLTILVTDVPYIARFYVPRMYNELVQDFIKDDSLRDVAEFAAGLCIFVLLTTFLAISLSWLIGQSIYLHRPKVVWAFEGGKPMTPSTTSLVRHLEWLPTAVLLLVAACLFSGFATFGERQDFDAAQPPAVELHADDLQGSRRER